MRSRLPGRWGALLMALGLFVQGVVGQDSAVALEAVRRLKGTDLEANPSLKAAVLRVVEQSREDPAYVELIRDFNLSSELPRLVPYALSRPGQPEGAEAIRLLLEKGRTKLVADALRQPRNEVAMVRLLGATASKESLPLLASVLDTSGNIPAVRREAVRALSTTHEGSRTLLAVAKRPGVAQDFLVEVRQTLQGTAWPEIVQEARRLGPSTPDDSQGDAPPLAELLKRRGDPARGAQVFRSPQVGCANCHRAPGVGVDFGPNLSEIGDKLGRDALFDSILNPSAGIAFGYEAWTFTLRNGDEITGLIGSETDDDLLVKLPGGATVRYAKPEIVRRDKQALSIMPAGLAQAMTPQELVDVVEYLTTLRKPSR